MTVLKGVYLFNTDSDLSLNIQFARNRTLSRLDYIKKNIKKWDLNMWFKVDPYLEIYHFRLQLLIVTSDMSRSCAHQKLLLSSNMHVCVYTCNTRVYRNDRADVTIVAMSTVSSVYSQTDMYPVLVISKRCFALNITLEKLSLWLFGGKQ